MKTAVIYSGQARTFGETFPNQYDKLLRLLPNPEFFVSVADDEQASAMTRLWERFPQEKVHIEYVVQPQIPEPEPGPKWLQMYPASSTPQAILRQLWALNRAWDFYLSYSLGHDVIVRVRPDLSFMRFEAPRGSSFYRSCFTPWWARWGGVNDRLALMDDYAANEYFRTFTKVEALMAQGCPLHPETLIDRSLRDGEIVPQHTLAADFCTIRLDGKVEPASITEIDIVEYARTK